MAPIRLLHLITELDVGGAERQLVNLLPRFDRARWHVAAAYLHGPAPLRAELDRAGLLVFAIRARNKFDPRALWRLVRLLRSERIQILHTHLIQADLLGFTAARLAGVPVIVSTKHSLDYFTGHPGWLKRLDQAVNRRLSAVVTVSEAVRDAYNLPGEVVYNGIDLAQFGGERPNPAQPVVCSVGALEPRKGHHILVQAWPKVREKFPAARLQIAGDGSQRAALASPGVELLGERHDIPDILRTAGVFVLPSLSEGFGIAALEAMAAGCAVVASDIGGIREVVADAGILVPPGDPAALANAIIDLLQNPTKARQLGAAAQEHAARFSIESTARQLENLYSRLLPASAHT